MKKLMMGLAMLAMLAAGAAEAPTPVKYVFLFIGDGMSFPQRMMADEFYFRTEKKHLAINEFPFQSPTVTRSADSFITDSAASGTAIACGTKTKNHYVGVDAAGKRLESVAEVAKKSGRKVGIVTSVTMNHATPAAFYAHNVSRGEDYKIGLDFLASGFDYFGGGGFSAANNKKDKAYRGDIYELAKQEGYTVARNRKEFDQVKPGCGKVLSVGSEGALPYAIDRKAGDFKLSEFVAQAVRQLEDGPNGFFLMAEGGKIDWMCHANDAATVLREVIDLDEAVAVAYDFYLKHPQETLVVVTGDHETGGLTLGFAGTGYSSYIERLAYQTCSRDVFIGQLKGLQKGAVDGKISFAEVIKLVEQDFGLKYTGEPNDPMRLHTAEREELKAAFDKSFPGGKVKKEGKEEYSDVNAVASVAIKLLDNRSGLGWTSGAHTALPVNTTAIGVHSDLFTGMIDNTEISKKLKLLVR